MNREKEIIRDRLKAWRLNSKPADLKRAGDQIINKLIAELNWQNINSLHLYIPVPSLREVDTWPLLNYAWQKHPDLTTAVFPVNKSGSSPSLKVNPSTKWRGLYPSSGVPLDEAFKFDVIIVPTLAFDQQLNRLGWGGGFYDRFLANQPQALKIGLAYAGSKITNGLPAEKLDVKLDKVISELGFQL